MNRKVANYKKEKGSLSLGAINSRDLKRFAKRQFSRLDQKKMNIAITHFQL